MKLSNNTFSYLLSAGIGGDYRKVFVRIFKSIGFSFDNEYKLIAPVYKELMAIAAEEDPDYECVYDVGEEAFIGISFHKMNMYTSLAGDPAYSDEFDPEEEEQHFDVVGDWDINLKTKEVEFGVNVGT